MIWCRNPIPLATLIFLATACTRVETAIVTAPPGNTACIVSDPNSEPASLTTVGLSTTVDPRNAPVPVTRGESIVFRQLYETLTDIDCEGQVTGVLAASWTVSEDSTEWLLALRPGLTFTDGTPVTARTVIEGWGLRTVFDGGWPDARVIDTDTIFFQTRQGGNLLARLSDRRFAVSLANSEGGWPLGTTGYSVQKHDPDNIEIALSANNAGRPGKITYRLYSDGDQRDLLDESIDLLVTGRHEVLDYSTSLTDYRRHALPWNRSYVLLSISSSPTGARIQNSDFLLFLEELARDAVRDEARPHLPPAWWQPADCQIGFDPHVPPAITRIAYVDGDPVARGIAERLTFLASTSVTLPDPLVHLRGVVTSDAVTVEELPSLLADGEIAMVVSVSRFVREMCGLGIFSRTNRTSIVPLIDTRENMITKLGLPNMTITDDGVPTFRANR